MEKFIKVIYSAIFFLGLNTVLCYQLSNQESMFLHQVKVFMILEPLLLLRLSKVDST